MTDVNLPVTLLAALIAATCCVFGTGPATAQNFDVKLGGKKLGLLSYASDDKADKLRSTLDSTPLGVFDGTFSATSTVVQTAIGEVTQIFQSTSKSSRKARDIGIVITNGIAVEATVRPKDERTDLSEVKNVPRNVVDPVSGIGRLIAARGCPGTFTIYDGRRAIRLTPAGSRKDGDLLTCLITYKVIAGPGHLSPLYISSVRLQAHYDLAGNEQRLMQMKLRAGLFNLILDRSN